MRNSGHFFQEPSLICIPNLVYFARQPLTWKFVAYSRRVYEDWWALGIPLRLDPGWLNSEEPEFSDYLNSSSLSIIQVFVVRSDRRVLGVDYVRIMCNLFQVNDIPRKVQISSKICINLHGEIWPEWRRFPRSKLTDGSWINVWRKPCTDLSL